MANLQNLSVSTARLLPTTEKIQDSRHVIERIDEEITKLEAQLQALRLKRELYASYISPLRRLPTEILTNIVDLALKDGSSVTVLTQVCSRLRYIVLGTPRFWSSILFHGSWVSLKYGIDDVYMGYGKEEALEFIIRHAGSTPLALIFGTTFSPRLLMPISSRNLVIRSLTFERLRGLPDTVMNLNFTCLRHLQVDLPDIVLEDAKKIMDAALDSTQNEIEFDFDLDSDDVEVLRHDFLHRVTYLRLWEGPNTFYGSKVSFPCLKKLDLFNNHELLNEANLDHIEKLTLSHGCSGTWKDLKTTSIPARLSELSLRYIRLYSIPQPRSLLELKRLSLTNVIIQGPLQKHLMFPKLKHLEITIFRYGQGYSDGFISVLTGTAALIKDENFFHGIPELETLSLTNMDLNSKLLDNLQFCPVLRSVVIDSCFMEDFISPFIEPGVHPTRLSALQEIYINNSWPDTIDMSFREFIKHLAATLPSIRVFGDGEVNNYWLG